jgi:hypothetical protein
MTEPVTDERIEEMLALAEKATPGPWQVVTDEHPFAFAESEALGKKLPATSGVHTQRRIFTTWEHPQAHAPDMVVNIAHGFGQPDNAVHYFVSIDEADAEHIARCDPSTIRSILTELVELRALVRLPALEGWRTVPEEPTEAMLDALHKTIRILVKPDQREANVLNDIETYHAVLAVAPPHPAETSISSFDVAAYVDEYEFRGDGGDHVPNAYERELLIDAIEGVLYALQEQQRRLNAAPAPPVKAGAE